VPDAVSVGNGANLKVATLGAPPTFGDGALVFSGTDRISVQIPSIDSGQVMRRRVTRIENSNPAVEATLVHGTRGVGPENVDCSAAPNAHLLRFCVVPRSPCAQVN